MEVKIMHNQDFIDAMDKINSVAKSMGYTNGIAWARKQMEDGRLNEYDYTEFDNCHDLRNLMAHGHAKDINISADTMRTVKVFFSTIVRPQPEPITQSQVLQKEFSENKHLEIQVGDYIIAVKPSRDKYVYYYKDCWRGRLRTQERHSDRFCIHECEFFQVVGTKTENGTTEKTVREIQTCGELCGPEYTMFDLCMRRDADRKTVGSHCRYYVIRGEGAKQLMEMRKRKMLYMFCNSFPELEARNDGKCYASFDFISYGFPTIFDGWRAIPNPNECASVETECYLAHKDCFTEHTEKFPKLLYDVHNKLIETEDDYLGIEKSDLPF